MALAYLFEPTTQFQARTGANLTAGFLRVYYTQTDDVAETYSDFAATPNEEEIVLDADGRAVVIVDDTKTYRLEVYNSNHGLLFTVDPITAIGGGGGSTLYRVISTDGTVSIDTTSAGDTTTFDLSTNTGDVPEMAEWGRFRAPAVSTPGALQLARVDGNIDVDTGVQLVAGNHYHVTTEIVVTPDGTGINYRTVTFELQDLDGNVLASRTDSVDTSTSEPVTPELSVDLYPTVDVEVVPVVSWDDDIASVEVPRMDVHRFYAGFRAVPNTVATKTWVSANFLPDSASGDFVPWSGLEGTGGTITAISGSGIGTNYTTVSSIASSYAYSAASSKVDQSAFDGCCSAMSGYISSITSDTADISAAVSGLTGTYLEQSAFTAYTSTALTGLQQDTGAISAAVSGLSGELGSYLPVSSIEGYAGKVTGISGSAIKGHEYTGIYPVVVDNTADEISVANTTLAVDETLSAYQSGNSAILGVVVSAVTSGLATEGYVDSAVSSKLDTTAFSNVSGTFLTSVDLTPYQEKSGMSAYAYESSLSSKLDASASSQFITSLSGYATEGYVDSSVSGKLDATASGMFQPSGDYAYNSSLNGYIPTSESSQFITSLAGYATEGYVDSSVSGKLDATASSQFYLTSNPAGYITGVDLSPYQLTADMSGYIPTSESANYQQASAMTAYQLSGDYAYNSAVSGKQDASAMTAYQEITGMTAYQPAGDYQPSGDYIYESALGWAEV